MIDQDTLDRLERITDGLQRFYSVRCEVCAFAQPCWLEREAELRGRAHEHDCLIQPVVLTGPIEPLGMGGSKRD